MHEQDWRLDIRDPHCMEAPIRQSAPDAVIHMAALLLVRGPYLDPLTTIEKNVNETSNALQAIAKTESGKAAVIVTTDKVHRNVGNAKGYVEADPRGGPDHCSASKAMTEILTTSWASSFDGCSIATAWVGVATEAGIPPKIYCS